MEDSTIEETVMSLFTADTLIESEYLQTLRRTQHLEPEKSLMLAVLKDAIDSFLENINARTGRRKQQYKAAEKWLFQKDHAWTFSFESICAILGLDPDYIRKGLRQREREESIRILSAVKPVSFSPRGTTARVATANSSPRSGQDRPVQQQRSSHLRKAVNSL